MKAPIITVLVVGVALAVAAADLGNRAPRKSGSGPIAQPPINPEAIRQGGDTMADAFAIPEIPFETTGTTTGYIDDYDEVCPYTGSTSPDVVYAFTPATAKVLDIDLCGSDFDTKIYVYDDQPDIVACNDDFYSGGDCGQYVSKLEAVQLHPHRAYYLVVDGWGGEYGDYVLAIREHETCNVVCSPIAMLEGEPPLVDDYDDTYNCGCNCLPDGIFQDIPGDATGYRTFCGVSGWYLYDGNSHRDTDWFHLAVPAGGTVTLEIEAEMPTYVYEMDLHCNISVIQNILAQPCEPATATFSAGDTPQTRRIIVLPATFEFPPGADNEYSYELRLSGLESAPVAVDAASWSEVKALFR